MSNDPDADRDRLTGARGREERTFSMYYELRGLIKISRRVRGGAGNLFGCQGHSVSIIARNSINNIMAASMFWTETTKTRAPAKKIPIDHRRGEGKSPLIHFSTGHARGANFLITKYVSPVKDEKKITPPTADEGFPFPAAFCTQLMGGNRSAWTQEGCVRKGRHKETA
ncbi:hypothetical protein NQ318_006983 [Aromia moschata]|uniref:Ribosomal protein S11 n=1 Tax=Aromia moschata TaxID=1265417 RepID=A0AAV8XD14_9CUCU|nr:hypothetical protein NQ318_006983 [Aromia moschata]